MSGPYDDIISLPHPTSSRHPRMPISDRVAQFSDRKSTRLNSSHDRQSRMPSSA